MKRGEIWTIAGGADHMGKPRPAVIVQDDAFDATASLTVCAFTSDPSDAPLFRLLVTPSEINGLAAPSRMMVDKITTAPKSKFGAKVGRLANEDMLRLDRVMLAFLGLAVAPARREKDP